MSSDQDFHYNFHRLHGWERLMRSLGSVVNICDAWHHAKTLSPPVHPCLHFSRGQDHHSNTLAKIIQKLSPASSPIPGTRPIFKRTFSVLFLFGWVFLFLSWWCKDEIINLTAHQNESGLQNMHFCHLSSFLKRAFYCLKWIAPLLLPDHSLLEIIGLPTGVLQRRQ